MNIVYKLLNASILERLVMATVTQIQDETTRSKDFIMGQEFLEVSSWK